MQFFAGSRADEYWFREGCYITEWANDQADAGASVARARVEPGATTRWHALAGITERYVMLSGRGRAEVGDRQIDVAPGDVVVIEPGEAQRIANTGESDLVFLAICTPRFRPEAYRDIESEESPR